MLACCVVVYYRNVSAINNDIDHKFVRISVKDR